MKKCKKEWDDKGPKWDRRTYPKKGIKNKGREEI